MPCSCASTPPAAAEVAPRAGSCGCGGKNTPRTGSCGCGAATPSAPITPLRFAALAAVAGALWLAAWFAVEPLSRLLAHGLFGLPEHTRAGRALQFFLYDVPKIFLLLALMVYVLAWLRAGLRTERLREYLAGKGRGLGYGLAAALGAVTPFCSCSSVPLFIGFASAGIPIGTTMAFLITSPIINEVAVVLLWGLLGWKFTLLYVTVGLAAGVAGGVFMDAIGAGRWLQPGVLRQQPCCQQSTQGSAPARLGLAERHAFASGEVAGIFRKVWLWVIVGVGIGAGLHGFVPEHWFAERLGAGQWWSVPAAVALGIPLYTNVTGVVPVMAGLLSKGLPVGTTLAFCMSAVAASLPELIMLGQVMRARLLAAFLGFLWVVFTLSGWLFNAVF